MMNLVPPVGWGDVATRSDLEHRLELHRAETRHDLLEFRNAVSAEVAVMHDRLAVTRTELAAMEARLGATFATLLLPSVRTGTAPVSV